MNIALSLLALLLAALTTCAAAPFKLGLAGSASPPLLLTTLSTNIYTNTLSVLSLTPLGGACPECGTPNHHDQRISLCEAASVVAAEFVSGEGGQAQTNRAVVWRSPKVSLLVTNVVLRARSQPGWTALPPAPGPLDAPRYDVTNRVLTNITPLKP